MYNMNAQTTYKCIIDVNVNSFFFFEYLKHSELIIF